MCRTCLELKLTKYEEVLLEMKQELIRHHQGCECCMQYGEFLIGVYEDLKILVLTKIKLLEQVCPQGISCVSIFDKMVKKRITNKLTNYTEQLFDIKEEIDNGKYVDRMNCMKDLNDDIQDIEDRFNN
jgi:hypothetical protein